MATQSFLFDMTLINTFWDNWNKTGWYGAESMVENQSKYEIIIADTSSTNPLNDVNDALENGEIKSTVNLHTGMIGKASLLYNKTDATWNRSISFSKDCVINIGDENIFVKALFIRNTDTNKVIAYSILSDRFPVTNKITIPKDTLVWNIINNRKCGQ